MSTTMDGGICRARGGGICLALCERFGGGLQSMAPRLMDCSAPPMAPKPKPMLSSSAAMLRCPVARVSQQPCPLAFVLRRLRVTPRYGILTVRCQAINATLRVVC
mmetsp:Transcript_13431/g.35719  ORF Transcript_13431/g.35719 Transcript_13431/m.35719 type:complete len:105 (+) Transcript_13431:342-656(+)